MEKRLLPNGLTLEIHDRTRLLAGDRYLVVLAFIVEVDIRKEYLENSSDVGRDYEELLKEYGPSVRYEAREERNFIGEEELDSVKKELIRAFLESALPYLSKPEFAPKLVFRRLRELRDPMRKFRRTGTHNSLYAS